MKQNSNGFTLMEMLIVIAIIAILIAIAIPVFASQLERSREAADLANVRSAYAQVSTEAQLGNPASTVTVDLRQKQEDWQSIDPINMVSSIPKIKVIRTTGKALPRQTEPVSCRIAKTMESFLLGAEQLIRPRRNTRLTQVWTQRSTFSFYMTQIFGRMAR